MKLKGLIPAAFTPMKENGDINPNQINNLVQYYEAEGFSALYVLGSTSEGPLLTLEERKIIAKEYISSAPDHLKIIIQVGDDCLRNAIELAQFAKDCGADAISSLPPRYFAPQTVPELISSLKEITDRVSELPFYYYHLPLLSGVNFDMFELIKTADREIQNFAGIKFTDTDLHKMPKCINYKNGKYQVFHGYDETLINGLMSGAEAAIGSTYNFSAKLYNKIIENFQKGQLDEARHYQLIAIDMIELLSQKYRGQPAFKAIMKILDLDCGPNRKPLQTLSKEEIKNLEKNLINNGFMKWIKS
jgi:N-acetylneuraminate lyase